MNPSLNSPPVNQDVRSMQREIGFFAVLLLLINISLLHGTWAARFAFHPEFFLAGEWWRLLTFPFAHVSSYHLLLDGTAFLILYSGFQKQTRRWRLTAVACSSVGGLLASLWAAPEIFSVGLCGLSAVAHGLMALSALHMALAENAKFSLAGIICFLMVTGKAFIEAITGTVVFQSMHVGDLGFPIAVCHAGGILGALMISGTLLFVPNANRSSHHSMRPISRNHK